MNSSDLRKIQPTSPNVRRQYQELGERLRDELSRGDYEIGQRLPTERDIADRFEVSRATVRDATIMLELEGLIEVRKGSGIYLIKLPGGNNSPGNEPDAEVGPFEMLQARQLIESNIAEFAATQITIKDVKRLQSALEKERSSLELGKKNYDADREFHLGIAEATQNTALVNTVDRLWWERENSKMWQLLQSRIIDGDYRKIWLQQHERIFLALKQKNSADAKHAMWEHIETVKQTLLNLADPDDPNFDGYLFATSASFNLNKG